MDTSAEKKCNRINLHIKKCEKDFYKDTKIVFFYFKSKNVYSLHGKNAFNMQ